jgi:hypothetical protein
VWTLVEDLSAGLVRVPETGLEIEDWRKLSLLHRLKEERRAAAGLLM